MVAGFGCVVGGDGGDGDSEEEGGTATMFPYPREQMIHEYQSRRATATGMLLDGECCSRSDTW